MSDASIPLRDALRAACRPLMADPFVSDEGQTQAAVLFTTRDFERALAEAGRLLLVLEEHAASAKAAAADAAMKAKAAAAAADAIREALLVAMTESGAPDIDLGHHVIGTQDGRPAVHIADLDALPEQFRRVKVEADKAAIGRALAAGQAVPGAALRNSAPYIVIRNREHSR